MKIFIVVLNYNGVDNTLSCLQSLKNLFISKNIEIKIVVVDNASKDISVKDIKSEYKEVIILENKENLGFSEGNNIGIRYALNNDASYVLLLNNDTFVDKMVLEELLKASENDKKIGIVSPKIYFAKGFEFHKDRYKKEELGKVIWYAGGIMDWKNIIGYHRGVDEVDNGQYDKTEVIDFASGCCMMVKREVFEKIGFFDEKYFLYYEDNDFCMRAKQAEFKIVFSPKAILWHKNAGSAGGSGSSLQDYYITRNRLLFGTRYAPFRSKVALVREGMKLLVMGRPWQKRGILDFYRGKFGRGSFTV